MLHVNKFTVKTNPTDFGKDIVKAIEIKPTEGRSDFTFKNAKELNSFADELRQTFETIMFFGCEVLYEVIDKNKEPYCNKCCSGLIGYPEIDRRTCRCGGLGYNVVDK